MAFTSNVYRQDNMYYGALQPKKLSPDRPGRDSKLARINQMRKIYLPKKRKLIDLTEMYCNF